MNKSGVLLSCDEAKSPGTVKAIAYTFVSLCSGCFFSVTLLGTLVTNMFVSFWD